MTIFLMAACLSACTVYNDKDSGVSSEVSINDYICYRCLTPLSRVIELSDFFHNYRNLDDQTLLDTLGIHFFGEYFSSENFTPESFDQEYWGKIVTGDEEGKYVATVSSYWTGTEAIYNVSVDADGAYTIVYDVDNNDETLDEGYEVVAEAVVNVVDGMYEVEALDIIYSEDSSDKPMEVTVESGSGSEILVIEPCSEGTYTVYPVDGTLYYSVSGYATYSFKVLFYGSYFEVIDEEQIVQTVNTIG